VINLSSGGPALTSALDNAGTCTQPSNLASDPVAFAFECAAQAGLVVTVAAGNQNGEAQYLNYPYLNSISSPSTAPSVISVGATLNSHVLTPTVSVRAADGPKGIGAQLTDSVFTPSSTGLNSAPLIDVTQLGDDGHACSALPAYSLTGAYALI